MKDSANPPSTGPRDAGFSPWQRLKTKNISYLTLPLLIMATVTEFVILATGWRYQQVVCLPKGMGVTFFGIGPIGATILAVELLKLPLAIWTASRFGWQKTFMICAGLPLICVLTFQLVKDMAVYEMGVAMTPASQMLEKASVEETKIAQLKGELAAIEQKKTEREKKLAELADRQNKAKADLADSIKRNEEARRDAISLTDYQSKELSEVETRKATIIKQASADTDQLQKTIADLRARRETELPRANQWNAEEARIENEYKTKMADYANKKSAYEKQKAEYDSAGIIKHALMSKPIDPGVPPVRESNKILKPAMVTDFDAQIKAKETELTAVNNKRREMVAQVEADARQVRLEFDNRSSSKREESDKKRETLTAARAALDVELKQEQKQIDADLAVAVKNVDGIRAQLDASQKKAEEYYEAREAAIRNTQVHRIATTVEIVRGLFMGQRPMSITASAKQRGDVLTDQISMVRIWVYPVLAFIVAFLPTLLVEIGFSTVFHPDQRQRPAHRLGFLGRRMHWLYTRAGRIKILRAERKAAAATNEIASRNQALTGKEAELQAARESASAAATKYEEQFEKHEKEWVAKYTDLAESLNRAVAEKDALRDLQKTEVERQVQMRQNAWQDRLTELRQELDNQRATSESERVALMQDHHRKLVEVSDDCKKQVIEARRKIADAEMVAVEKSTRMNHDLEQALSDREDTEKELKQQEESFALKLAQVKDDAAREMDKTVRQEKHRLELQQVEFERKLAQRDQNSEQRAKQREQEISSAFEARLAEQKSKLDESVEQAMELKRQLETEARDASARLKIELQQKQLAFDARLKEREQELSDAFEARLAEQKGKVEQNAGRAGELTRQLEAQSREANARLKSELQQKEQAFEARLKQREQELSDALETRLAQEKNKLEQSAGRVVELEHQLEAQSRETNGRLKHELQQKEQSFEARLKQREQEWLIQAEKRETDSQKQWASDLRARQEDWERQAESRIRATETRMANEAEQKEELVAAKSRQRDQQWQLKLDTARAESEAELKDLLRRRDVEHEVAIGELQAGFRRELQQKEEATQASAKQREMDLMAQMAARAEATQAAAKAEWDTQFETKTRLVIEPFRMQLARTEKERDEARQTADETSRELQKLEKRLTDTAMFLNTWRNGKHPVGTS